MTRLRMLGIMALTLVAVAIPAAAAQAEGPFYRIEGSRLAPGQVEPIEGTISKEYVLKAGTIEVKCTKQEFNGIYEGGKLKSASKSLEVVYYEGCTVTGNGEGCEVFAERLEGKKELGTIRTNLLRNTLDFTNKEEKEGEKVLVLFEPLEGIVFVTLKFTGAGCKVTESAVEGTVAAEAVAENGAEEPGGAVTVKVNEPKGKVGFVSFPSPAIKVDFVEKEGKREEKKVSLKAFGLASELVGRSKVKLNSKESFAIVTK